jgi:hypothetical protein
MVKGSMVRALLIAAVALLGACTGTHGAMQSSAKGAPQPTGMSIAPSVGGDWITQDNRIPPGSR